VDAPFPERAQHHIKNAERTRRAEERLRLLRERLNAALAGSPRAAVREASKGLPALAGWYRGSYINQARTAAEDASAVKSPAGSSYAGDGIWALLLLSRSPSDLRCSRHLRLGSVFMCRGDAYPALPLLAEQREGSYIELAQAAAEERFRRKFSGSWIDRQIRTLGTLFLVARQQPRLARAMPIERDGRLMVGLSRMIRFGEIEVARIPKRICGNSATTSG
jgi:hypothetical protein